MRVLKKVIWPYSMELDVKKEDLDPDAWCHENLGHRFKEWYSYNNTRTGKRVFAFKDEQTLLVFKIMWRK